jgi:para-nitrobenzyl esterase
MKFQSGSRVRGRLVSSVAYPLIACSAIFYIHVAATDEAPPVVATTNGSVRGTQESGVYMFKGVPYGGSTAGRQRFLPPTRPVSWKRVRDATKYGSSCMQSPPAPDDPFRKLLPPMSEDCLVLNVWTPTLTAGQKRPVVVFVHAGGFSTGSGTDVVGTGGLMAAQKYGVVFVTVNHRLGVLGYLHLGGLDPERFTGSGNAALLDLIASLQWIRDNIVSFGGDADNVTLAGQSGGANKISMLLAMPAATGLFHRAILQSGGLRRALTSEQAIRTTQELLDRLRIKPRNMKQLQSIPAEQLVAAAGSGFTPVVDGVTLPSHPFDPAGSNFSVDVPILIGTNKDEFPSYGKWREGPEPISDEAAANGLRELGGHNPEDVVAAYRKSDLDLSPGDLLGLIFSDMAYSWESIRIAERKHAQHAAPAYMYRFDWKRPGDAKSKASHGREFRFLPYGGPPLSSEEQALPLADLMSRAWMAFVRTGNPDITGLPHWPAYDPENRATMIFNEQGKVVNDPDRDKRLAILSLVGP